MSANKKLVALAALTLVSGLAHAQSQLKVYGAVDVSFGSFSAAHTKGESDRVTAVQSGKMMTSYIGFAGSEDLGGGLKAEFNLESFLGADTGSVVTNNAGNFWGRTSNVGLSGGFGKVALGQYDNPLFTSGYTYNPFGSSYGFSPTMRHLYSFAGGGILAGTPAVGFDTGWVNSITYESPNFSGFSFVGQLALKETNSATAANKNDKNSFTLAGTYGAGPFAATLTYVNAGPSHASGTTTSSFALGANSSGAYPTKEKVIDLGVSYDFGVLKAFGQYTNRKDKTNDIAVTDAGFNIKDSMYQIGVTVPVTDKGNVLASFGSMKRTYLDSDESKITDNVFSVGYDYNLSKRTDVYGVFSNNTQTDLKSGKTFAVGIKHNF